MRKSLALLLLAAALPLSAQTTIQVHAHRGGRAARPENTIPAVQYAIGLNVEAIELDLAVTKDNVLVVSHSPYLSQPHYDDPRMNAVLANERHCVGPELPAGTLIHSLTRSFSSTTAAPPASADAIRLSSRSIWSHEQPCVCVDAVPAL